MFTDEILLKLLTHHHTTWCWPSRLSWSFIAHWVLLFRGYLGPRLIWKSHCKAVRGKSLRALSSLNLLFRSSLPLSSKLLIYKPFIQPIMTYASLAWGFISKFNISHLQVVQNRALRIIGGYDWYTCTEQLHWTMQFQCLIASLNLWLWNFMFLLEIAKTGISKS